MLGDYFQLMRTSGKSEGLNRTADLIQVSIDVKAIAKDLSVPIVIAAQVNRQCESREDRRGRLSDLKECGQLEQDASTVMFLYREKYYAMKDGETDFTGSDAGSSSRTGAHAMKWG